MTDQAAWLRSLVRDIPDYPIEGVLFRDVTPLLAEPGAIKAAADLLAEPFVGLGQTDAIDVVAGIEARGFLFGPPVADALGVGFVPIRKPGKLPATVITQTYELEYGTDELQMHADAVGPGMRVLIVDDVLATGGTATAATALVEQGGATVASYGFLIEIGMLAGRERLDAAVHTVIDYS